ncbi:hypothetical protein [Nocardia sp. NPDC046763]|uniref:hypothetical protein n=1 Tax=Nocardia sp. NPDC046763 TaxID=3155256 RepID=UPI0033DA0226
MAFIAGDMIVQIEMVKELIADLTEIGHLGTDGLHSTDVARFSGLAEDLVACAVIADRRSGAGPDRRGTGPDRRRGPRPARSSAARRGVADPGSRRECRKRVVPDNAFLHSIQSPAEIQRSFSEHARSITSGDPRPDRVTVCAVPAGCARSRGYYTQVKSCSQTFSPVCEVA